MSKRKTVLIVIVSVFVLLLGCALFFLLYFRLPTPKTDTEIDVWYVGSEALWRSFPDAVSEYNNSEGSLKGITVSARSFADEELMYETLSLASELPDIVICDSDLAAALDGMCSLSDMIRVMRSLDMSHLSRDFVDNTKLNDKQLLVPLASSVSVFLVNTELYPDAGAQKTFEQLCASSGDYYAENEATMFAISDYAMFFRNASMQLGVSFDGVNPHDTDDETNKMIYRQIAAAAYERGCFAAESDPAKLVAEGSLPCAIVSSESVMRYAGLMDENKISIGVYPVMYGGQLLLDERVSGACIIDSDEDSVKAAALFIEWFASDTVNKSYVGNSGCMCADGTMPLCDGGAMYSKLRGYMTSLKQEGKLIICAPDADYCVRSYSFNNTLKTIMNSLD